ncbi:MAG: vWA domain-containing protein [Planctomycetales bacterium]
MNRRQTQRRGAVIVLAAVCLIVIFAFAAFTVDVGYISLARTQMQASADAAALAAAAELSGGEKAVRSAAEAVAGKNFVGQQPTHIVSEEDVELGKWDDLTRTFTPLLGKAQESADSVRVTVKLDATRDNALPLFFAPLLGHRDAAIKVQSVASTGHDKPRDIVLVIDCSGSMAQYNRMVYTRAAALAFIEELGPRDRLGLAVYSYPVETITEVVTGKGKSKKKKVTEVVETVLTGFLEDGLAFDFSPIKGRIPKLDPGEYADLTNIGGGMRVALEEFVDSPRTDLKPGEEVEKTMVLMTDGNANVTEAPASSPMESIYYYADVAKQQNVIIHGITLGQSAAKGPIMQAASTTGGDYYHVADGNLSGLFEVYKAIGRGDGHPKLVQ